MRVHVLKPTRQNVPAWMHEYQRLYFRELPSPLVDIEFVEYSEIAKLPEKSLLWLIDPVDMYSDISRFVNLIAFTQVNGSSLNRFSLVPSRNADRLQANIMAGVIVFDEFLSEVHQKIYPGGCRYMPIGYPVEPLYTPPDDLERFGIIVSCRMVPEKQVYLAAYMVSPFVGKMPVTFVLSERDMPERYSSHLRNLGIDVVPEMEHLDYLKLLAKHKWYLSCSLADTHCVGAVEAHMLGVKPILPSYHNMIYPVQPFKGCNFKPFDCYGVECIINNDDPIDSFENERYDPSVCAGKLYNELLRLNEA